MKLHPLLGSSTDPEKISLTIKSIGVWLVPGVLALVTVLGWDVTKVELVDLVNNLAILSASAMTIVGIVRKIYIKIIG